MDKRLSFNEDAALYDRMRPHYPREVFEEIIRYSNLSADASVIEIGMGTGQATEPFLKTGCRLTAIEPGKSLADFSRRKFLPYRNLTIENTFFEDFQTGGRSDLIYSATAFHWVPQEIGCVKAFELLKSGGTLALFWNRPFVGRRDDPLHQEIQRIYGRWMPEQDTKPVESDMSRYEKIRQAILSHGFIRFKFQLYHSTRCFSAEEYVNLLDTYSDHRSLPPDAKVPFYNEIRKAIRRRGNRLTVYDTVDLHLCQRP